MKVTVILITLVNLALSQDLKTGDICQIGLESVGICTEISKCASAQENLFCDPSNNVVCCPEEPKFRPVCEGRSGGRRKRKIDPDYVIGGVPAQSFEFPHLVAIGYEAYGDTVWSCGGALITPNFVLTAAHCLQDPRNKEIVATWVRLGDIDLKDNSDDHDVQTIAVLERIPHPEYEPRILHHDIALLELEDSVQLVPNKIETACIQVTRSIANLKPIIAGWGATEEGRLRKDQKLLKAELDFQEMEKCVKVTSRFSESYIERVLPNGLHDEPMICAGKLQGGIDSCKGDSGGPLSQLVNATNCKYNIVAVTSFGYKCGIANTPAIYTRISHYLPWIESKVCSYE